MKILIVEDDEILGEGLARVLDHSGFTVSVAATGEEADYVLSSQHVDLIILDIGLPGIDGLQLLRRIRKRSEGLPILILSARDALQDRVEGFRVGADDYVCKPFEMPELVLRIKALLRRSYGITEDELTVGNLRLNVRGRRATVGETYIDLSAREFEVLETLMLRESHVVSKEELMQRLYEGDEEVGYNAIEVFLHRIRRKIIASDVVIRTIRGLGYLLERDRNGKA